jgi:hypothetical protein
VSVVQNYPDFEPTPSVSDIRRALVEAVIRYGRGEQTHEVAQYLGIDEFPEAAVFDALGYLRDRGVEDSDEALAAQRLIEHLLDSGTTRNATVEMLLSCGLMGCLPDVIDAVRPRLDQSEQARIDVET